jgi:hypothetical protein
MRRIARLVMLGLVVVAMTLGVSIGTGHATTIWFDDFSDGNAEDGNPETWVPHPAPALQGDYNATSGDYIFTPGFGAGTNDAMVASIEDKTFTGTSVRTRARAASPGDVGLVARLDSATVSAYIGLVDSNGFFTMSRAEGGAVSDEFNFVEQFEDISAAEDIIVQLDVIGETVSLSAWRPGDPQPEPRFVETDSAFASGTTGLMFAEVDDLASGIFYWATAASARIINGDVNFDGDVNGLDVDPFVAAVLGGSYDAPADMNGDGAVDGLDVDPFVEAVVGGGTQSVPEPSTLLLCIIALGVVGGWRKWGG